VARSSADAVTATPYALFSLGERRDSAMLVLRVERVCQGDPEEFDDAYLREKAVGRG
jgi:hypothetical protein